VTPWRSTGLVAGRELYQAFRRKSFWIVAALLLVGATVAMIVPSLTGGTDTDRVGLVGASPAVADALRAAGPALDVTIVVEPLSDRAAAERAVDDGDVDVAGVAGVTGVAGADPVVIVQADEHGRLVGVVQQVLAADALANRLTAEGLSPSDAASVVSAPPPAVVELDQERTDRRLAALAISLVLYLALLSLMIQVANGTAIEKANRISEVLLAIVRPGPLLFGKVIGVGVGGLITLACAAIPVAVKLGAGGDLPAGFGGAVASGAAWAVLGLALFLTIAGSLGALVERQEEVGSLVAPLTMILVGSFVVAQSAPESSLAAVLAWVPLTSPIMVPTRLAVGASSPAEIVGSLVLMVVAVVVAVRVGAGIFRRAIVRTGRRIRVREVLRAA
jgi:ABC-2 type transport system permease protein